MREFFKSIIKNSILILFFSLVFTYIFFYFSNSRQNFNYAEWFVFSVILCFVMLFVMGRLINYFGNIRYLRSPLSTIDNMTGEEFENYLKIYFESIGYKVKKTPASNDYGADLYCKNKNEVVVVQAKRYEGKVGNSAVQEVVAAREYYEADRCMVVTNSYFTKNAVNLAEVNQVELWDRDRLISNVRRRKG